MGAGPSARRPEEAFTFVELLLAVTLIMLLAGALVYSFSALHQNARLEEGTLQMEGLLRFARAQAANTGRRVQVVFEDTTTNAPTSSGTGIRLTWEPDPLGQPGRFEDLAETTWQIQGIGDLVEIEEVQLQNEDAANSGSLAAEEKILGGQQEQAELPEPLAPITFYPDGSCESAKIILASRTADEVRRMSVQLVGITGAISHRLVVTNEVDSPLAGLADTENPVAESVTSPSP